MRKYLVPLLLCSAIGAVVVVAVLANREKERNQPVVATKDPDKDAEASKDSRYKRPKTPTALSQNRALSELERALGRKDLSHAFHFRSLVCQQMDEIMDSETLIRNLLNAIREHGINSDDPKRRMLMFGILRVFPHAEATAMIAAEYFRAQDEEERLLLLEAMAHDYHDPEMASVWAVDKALTAESDEHRLRAFMVVKDFSKSYDVTFKTAAAIYAGTTRVKQSRRMIEEISMICGPNHKARDWVRQRMANPRGDELGVAVAYIDGWGTHKDAAQLETLAEEFPGQGDFLRERAEAIRLAIRLKKLDPNAQADADAAKKKRLEEMAAEAKNK